MRQAVAREAPVGWLGRFRRSRIPVLIVSLSAVLLGALFVSVAVMTNDILGTQRRVEMATERFHRLDLAARTQRQFDDYRYWLTELSVSQLMLSERRAQQARAALEENLTALAVFAPQEAEAVREDAAAFGEQANRAADAYADGNRIIGNTALAAARNFSDSVNSTFAELTSRLDTEADAARMLAKSASERAVLRGVIAVALLLLVGVAITAFVLRAILGPLGRVDRAIAGLTAGNLDIALPRAGDDEFGRISRTLGMLRDSQIERDRLEAEAEAQRQTIVTAIETIPDGFALYDARQRLVLVNRQYLEIFPFIADLMTPGRSFVEIMRAQLERGAAETNGLPPEDWLAGVVERHTAESSFAEQRLATGAIIRIAKRRTPDGGTVAVYTDISDLISRQEELEHAREEAEEANRAKSTFLASMSHELRTPLNAIIGYSEMLIEDAQDLGEAQFSEDLEKIMVSGRHLLALINDILDLSKIEAGKMEIFVEPFPLGEVLRDVATTVEPLVKKNGNRLTLDFALDDDEIVTDKTKLRQNLFNLLSNAAKFTRDGEITLRVARHGGPGHDAFEFAVSDTGIGMNEAQLSRLFQAFVQADSSTTRNYGGTGLGLTITQRFVELMGGTISVESEEGKGSTFRFVIPARPAETPALPEPGETRADGAKTVLVIDDEPRARAAISAMAREAGFEVIEAATGKNGLEMARRSLPDAIVLDVIMPGLDGWDVMREIKKDPELCAIPVILATVLSDREMGMTLGAVEYLTKPIDPKLLEKTLASATGPSGRDVLVVDDDAATRALLRRVLVRDGWSVREAANGRQGLEQILARRPALVLLDLMMPEMDGFDVLAEIGANPDLADLRTVVITAKDLTRAEVDWLQSRTTALVAKGVTGRADLVAALQRHVTETPG